MEYFNFSQSSNFVIKLSNTTFGQIDLIWPRVKYIKKFIQSPQFIKLHLNTHSKALWQVWTLLTTIYQNFDQGWPTIWSSIVANFRAIVKIIYFHLIWLLTNWNRTWNEKEISKSLKKCGILSKKWIWYHFPMIITL